MFTRLARILAWAIAISPSVALGLGLGEIEAQSALNEPFNARIDLVSPEQDAVQGLDVRLAPPEAYERAGLERMSALSKLEFSVQQGPAGPYIQVESSEAVREPFVTFLVELSWPQGRVQREYTVFLDPPTMTSEKPRTAEGPTTQPGRAAPTAGAERAADDDDRPARQRSAQRAQREPQPRSPAEPERERRAEARTAGQDEGASEYGPIRRGETLWEIAQRARTGTAVTQNQMMLAIYRRNPDAFEGNINLLKQGAVLRIPDTRAAATIETDRAIRTVRQQNETYRTEIRQPSGEADTQVASAAGEDGEDSRLELVAPRQEDADSANGAGSPDAEGDGTDSGDGDSASDTGDDGSEGVSAERVRELEARVQELQEMVAIKDTRLAELQRRLEEARASDTGDGGEQNDDGRDEPAADQQAAADGTDGDADSETEAGDTAAEPDAGTGDDESDVAMTGDEGAPDEEAAEEEVAEEEQAAQQAAEEGAGEGTEGDPGQEAEEETAAGAGEAGEGGERDPDAQAEPAAEARAGAEQDAGAQSGQSAEAGDREGGQPEQDAAAGAGQDDGDDRDEPTTMAAADGGGGPDGGTSVEPGGAGAPQAETGGGSIMDQARSLLAPVRGMTGNPMVLAGLGAALVLLLSSMLYAARRRSAARAESLSDEATLEGLEIVDDAEAQAHPGQSGGTHEDASDLAAALEEGAEETPARAGGQEPGDWMQGGDAAGGAPTGGPESGELRPDEVDVASEIDFHLSQGLHDEALELAERAVERDPDNRDLWLKRLQARHAAGDSERFLAEAKELADAPQGQADSVWEKVAALGRQILPHEPLFQQGEQDVADAALDTEQADADIPTSTVSGTDDVLGGTVAQGEAQQGGDLDVDVGDLEFDLSEAEQSGAEGFGSGGESGAGSGETDLGIDLEPSAEGAWEGEPSAESAADAPASPSADDLSLDFDLEQAESGASGSESGEEQSPAPSADDLTGGSSAGSEDTGEYQSLGEVAAGPEQASGSDDTSDALEIDLDDLDIDTGEVSTGGAASADDTAGSADDTASFSPDETARAPAGVGEPEEQSAAEAEGPGEQLSMPDEAASGGMEAGSSSDVDQVGTKIDLAEAYIGMDDADGARSLLEEVLSEGNSEQRDKAQELLERLGGASAAPNSGAGGAEAAAGSGSAGVDTQGEEPLGEGDDVGTKLDLARAYIGMEDSDGARNILNEVIRDGDEAQRREAEALLEELS